MITCPNCSETMIRMNRFGYEHIDQTKATGTHTCPECGYSEDR